MLLQCKFCSYFSANQRQVIRHYKVTHGFNGTTSLFPCIYRDCPCTLKTQVALKKHLATQHARQIDSEPVNAQLLCELCDFCEPFNLKKYFVHLGRHVQSKETVNCPFKQCSFKSNVYNTFKAHKSRYHHASSVDDVRPDIIKFESEAHAVVTDHAHLEDDVELGLNSDDADEYEEEDIGEIIKYSLASLFLRMQTVLHVSKSAIQDIVDELYQISLLTQTFTFRSIKPILEHHNCKCDAPLLAQVSDIVQKSNPFKILSREKELGTTYRRATFYKDNFTVIEPVEYVLDAARQRTFVYVPILHVLTELLNRNDVLDKEHSSGSQTSQYESFYDGLNRKKNELLSGEEFHIALELFIDDFEVCNPLGTAKTDYKVCGVYWVIVNLPLQYRSSLSSIYLATLCHRKNIITFGYERILEPLIKDIALLENHGLFVQRLGASVTGTIAYVSADNLGAHSLAGFRECFNGGKFCRFCVADHNDKQSCQVKSGKFTLRTQESIDNCVSELQQNERLKSVDGVKRACPLDRLSFFQTADGFPPDILHDLFEGIVLEELNDAIRTFPYRFVDKRNKPHKITHSSLVKGTIGGNGHENWTLLRLLPLIIGHLVPKHNKAWDILLPKFTEESLCYLESKISDHRSLLQEVFPDYKLKPKHHFIEHYAHLVKCFGPLVDFWTIRFEAKHSYFKKVVRDVNNFKNILLTLSTHHQLLLAYHLRLPNVFKPDLEVVNVTNISPELLEFSVKTAVEGLCGVTGHGRAVQAALEPPAAAKTATPAPAPPERQRRPAEERGGSAATATGNRLPRASPGSSLEQPRPAAPLPGDQEPKAPCSRRRWEGSCLVALVEGGDSKTVPGPPRSYLRGPAVGPPPEPIQPAPERYPQRHLRQPEQQPQASGLRDGGGGWGGRVTLGRYGNPEKSPGPERKPLRWRVAGRYPATYIYPCPVSEGPKGKPLRWRVAGLTLPQLPFNRNTTV
ncbi:hypothetical protein N1851_033866 [Merluccius polli]|uniref:C2H2-type domain-containing protein n=1 Tax=Merluccius polli TaxID=89951 RepID=A0AA47M0X8_MERPO|nr:hypothetical protein N1851_033866 [Merluccius polli]